MIDYPHRRLNVLTNEWVLVPPIEPNDHGKGKSKRYPAKSCQSMNPHAISALATKGPAGIAIPLMNPHLCSRMTSRL